MGQDRCATPEGTARYVNRLSAFTAQGHFRQQQRLWMSSIGLGTASGDCDDPTDAEYCHSIKRAYELGANVFDSAISYRSQRSERIVGAALGLIFKSGRGRRDEVIITTKGGFFPIVSEQSRDSRAWVLANVINPGLARPDEIVGDIHCISPAYLEDQLSRSLENLALDCIDIYYIHNPEIQLEAVTREEFNNRVYAAFQLLERAAADGRIQFYGAATWEGYRQELGGRTYLSLAEMVTIAREVGGEHHRFRAIQLPFNLAMPEALTMSNQVVDGEVMPVLTAADRLGITVMCSATVRQGKLVRHLPSLITELFGGLSTDAQRAIQFVRSMPGVTTALVGMGRRSHVEENLEVAKLSPTPLEDSFRDM